uniref:Uncharacterized protein n=1 Tax=Ditylenchus dipsaci TaxID=166011 RepID=A0A915EJ04_9BILA
MISSDHCCTKALEDLKPISLKQMKVPYVHAGRYLLCRTITDAFRVAIEFIVYQYLLAAQRLHSAHQRACTEVCKCQQPGIIILDSPSDVIFVDETDLSMKQFSGDSVPGSRLTNCPLKRIKQRQPTVWGKDYEGALQFYQRALRLQPASPVISLNRAAALLKLERFYEAYQEAELALNAGCNREKLFLD